MIININSKRIEQLKNSYVLKNPLMLYEVKEQKFDSYIERVNNYITSFINEYKVKLDNLKGSYVLKNPLSTYEVKEQKLKNYIEVLNKIVINKIDSSKHNYELMINKLELLNPLNILSKGYSLVTIDGNVVKSKNELKVNDNINIRMHEGNIKAVVKEIE